MNASCQARLGAIAEKFKTCRGALSALGDETRQLIILALLESDRHGVRVGRLTQKVHLSRLSVSHHLQILRDAGIVNMRREGTRNYYYIDARESQWETLHALLTLVCEGLRESALPQKGQDAGE